MTITHATHRQVISALALSALLLACGDSNNSNGPETTPPGMPDPPGPSFQADIIWTEFGIPHITAPDFAGAGYGFGYAFAKINFCGLMREIVAANGQTARYFDDGGDVSRDFLYTWINTDERIQRIFIDEQSQDTRDLARGYVAGVNRYLAETGVENLPAGEEGCRGEEWVRPISVIDLGKLLHKKILRGSADPLAEVTFAAAPSLPTAMRNSATEREAAMQALAGLEPSRLAERLGLPASQEMGSNGYGIGAQASQSSAGLVLSNTHFPWQGDLRWNMSHVTIPGVYDIFGVALVGIPLPVMGFNKDLAWTHTVATGERFTFFELTLTADNPLQYLYDGEHRDIEPHAVSIERRLADGTVETLQHTFYTSHFGPIVDLEAFSALVAGWPNVFGTVMSYRDANIDNLRGFDMWRAMGQATSMEEFTAATAQLGNPWSNTVAADRHGDAFYGDISVVPHVTQQDLTACVRGALAALITGLGVTTLDGSDSACEWGSDEGAPPGLFGYDNLPKLETRDYGANANNSYWIPSDSVRLEGFSPLIGDERSEIDFRARQVMINAEQRKAGSDGLGDPGFNIDNLLAAFSALRVLGIDERDIAARLSSLRAVPGRAECFSVPGRATTVVDYSHTPQALQAILRTIREHCSGALWCVFGCGGDRDTGKRPLMAAVAEKLADRVIVTDDNPRSECGDQIVDDILQGFEKPDSICVERNRETAIRHAIERAVVGDWVVIAGKGHEDYQIIGDRRIHLSDREIVAAMLQGQGDD